MANLDDLLDAKAVAERLRIPYRTISRMAKDGRLPAHQLPGGQYVFDAAEIDALAPIARELKAEQKAVAK